MAVAVTGPRHRHAPASMQAALLLLVVLLALTQATGDESFIVVLDDLQQVDGSSGSLSQGRFSHADRVAAELEASGSAVRRNLREVGLLFVDGDEAFAKRALNTAGVQGVARDAEIAAHGHGDRARDGVDPSRGAGTGPEAPGDRRDDDPHSRHLRVGSETTCRRLRGATAAGGAAAAPGRVGAGALPGDCRNYDSADYAPGHEEDSGGPFIKPNLEQLQWGLQAMHVKQAHSQGITGRSRGNQPGAPVFRAKVAVLGLGYRAHPDLDNVLDTERSRSFVPLSWTSDVTQADAFEPLKAADACRSTAVPPCPFADNSSPTTEMMSLIAADAHDGGMLGVAPDARVTVYKTLSDFTRTGRESWAVAAIMAAADAGEHIILLGYNHSGYVKAGGTEDSDGTTVSEDEAKKRTTAYSRAAEYAASKGTVIFVGANEDRSYRTSPDARAGKDLLSHDSVKDYATEMETRVFPLIDKNIYTVTGTGPSHRAEDRRTVLDRFGIYNYYGDVVSFAAPGGDDRVFSNLRCNVDLGPAYRGERAVRCLDMDYLVTAGYSVGSTTAPRTLQNAGYRFNFGTSLAAAHIAGIAALIVGRNGVPMRPDQLIEALKAICDDIGDKKHFGFGRPNAGRIGDLPVWSLD